MSVATVGATGAGAGAPRRTWAFVPIAVACCMVVIAISEGVLLARRVGRLETSSQVLDKIVNEIFHHQREFNEAAQLQSKEAKLQLGAVEQLGKETQNEMAQLADKLAKIDKAKKELVWLMSTFKAEKAVDSSEYKTVAKNVEALQQRSQSLQQDMKSLQLGLSKSNETQYQYLQKSLKLLQQAVLKHTKSLQQGIGRNIESVQLEMSRHIDALQQEMAKNNESVQLDLVRMSFLMNLNKEEIQRISQLTEHAKDGVPQAQQLADATAKSIESLKLDMAKLNVLLNTNKDEIQRLSQLTEHAKDGVPQDKQLPEDAAKTIESLKLDMAKLNVLMNTNKDEVQRLSTAKANLTLPPEAASNIEILQLDVAELSLRMKMCKEEISHLRQALEQATKRLTDHLLNAGSGAMDVSSGANGDSDGQQEADAAASGEPQDGAAEQEGDKDFKTWEQLSATETMAVEQETEGSAAALDKKPEVKFTSATEQ